MATETLEPPNTPKFNEMAASLQKDLDAFKTAEKPPEPSSKPVDPPPIKIVDKNAPAKAAEKPPEQKVQSDDEVVAEMLSDKAEPPPEIKSEGGKKHWNTYKNSVKKVFESKDKTIAEKEAAIKKLTEDFTKAQQQAQTKLDPAELEKIKKERDEFSEQLKVIAVERHPEFVQHFTAKIEATITEAKQIVGDKLAAKVEGILRLPESEYKREQLEALVEELPSDLAKSEFASVVRDARKIENERKAELAKSGEHYKKILEQEKQTTAQKSESLTKSFKTALQEAQDAKEGLAAFQTKEGDTEWNAAVEGRVKLAEAFFTGKMPDSERAKLALWGAAAEPILRSSMGEINRLNTELNTAKEQIAKLTGATPNLNPNPPTKEVNDGVPKTFSGAVTHDLRRMNKQ